MHQNETTRESQASQAFRDSRELHVVIGAGAIGSGVAWALAARDPRVRNHQVRIWTLRICGPVSPAGRADRRRRKRRRGDGPVH